MKFFYMFICVAILLSCRNLHSLDCHHEIDCVPYAISLRSYPISYDNYKGGIGIVFYIDKNGILINSKVYSLNISDGQRKIDFVYSIPKIDENIVYPDSIIRIVYDLQSIISHPHILKTECINSNNIYTIPMIFKIGGSRDSPDPLFR